VHQPRLSDTGLAAHQHCCLLAGQDALERTSQELQLRLASHQDGADETRRHAGIMPEGRDESILISDNIRANESQP
jgi:hypothetical protein